MSELHKKRGPDHRFHNIVLATDFLESSRLALDYAVAMAYHFGSTITIVHAFDLSYEAEEAEILWHKSSVSRTMATGRLEAFAAGVRRLGVSVNVDLREGEPCPAILKSASEHRCDLLVIGTHGIYRGVHHLVIGSNAEKILLSTPCPTLTVGRHVMAGIDLDLKLAEVLVITDTHCENLKPLKFGLWLGNEFGVPVDIMYVRSDGEMDESAFGNRLESLLQDSPANEMAEVEPRWLSAGFHLGRIFNAQDVIRHVESPANRLIVTGVHPMSRIERHLQGSFAFELAARAASPLLSLPCEPSEGGES